MKNILLIAGGGTLGSYTSAEALRLGHAVDVICLEDKVSDHANLRYFRFRVNLDSLTGFLAGKHYDAIVNFLHYSTAEAYQPFHELLMQHTDQLVFLSSYRVYADLQHPLTETAPLLGDVLDDADFLQNEGYAMGKTRCERYLRTQPLDKVTIIRPVISFSALRLDINMHNLHAVLDAAKGGYALPLPEGARNLTAGLDWAGNSGKLIAHLLCNPAAMGETFTISSGQSNTWETVAKWYTELCGVQFDWVPDDQYPLEPGDSWRLYYDRLYDRDVDASKVLAATGLTAADFMPVRDAIALEIANAQQA